MRLKRVIGALAVAVVAAQGLAGCDPEGIIVYRDDGWRGGRYVFSGSDANYESNDFEGTSTDIGDKVSSVFNNTDRWVAFFEHDTYQGDAVCVAPRTRVNDLGDYNLNHAVNQPFSSLEDEASSHRTYTTRPVRWEDGGPCDVYVPPQT